MASPKVYKLWENLLFLFGNLWRWNSRITVLSILRAPFVVAIPLLGLVLARTVVSFAETNAGLPRMMAGIGAICAITAICAVILSFLNGQNERMLNVSVIRFQQMVFEYMMSHDYEYNESPKGLSDARKSLDNMTRGVPAVETASSFLGNVIGLFSYAVFIITLNPFILPIICLTTLLNYFLLKKITEWNHRNKDSWLAIDRKRWYLEAAVKDTVPAKDIRLYNMAGWLRGTFAAVLKQRMAWHRKEETYGFWIDILCASLSFIREGAAYCLLISMMYRNHIAAADFVLYFGLIAGFTAWLDGLIDNLFRWDWINTGLNELRAYFDYENKSNRKAGVSVPEEAFSIEFRNVSYQFSGSEAALFTDFNLTINSGEKVAVVGLNGAGKTTLVKLLCGLYRPGGGMILANGQPIDSYHIEAYHSLFSAVFQDITVFPMTIRENITCQTGGINEERLENALRLSGFDEAVRKYKDGADTFLIRGIHPGAAELSGGELQKLALARAIYRDGQFLILDEPTAALDPIAESHIYQQYNDIAAGKTAVFISHRLVSTKFCDRILFLADGKIIEDGSHAELMAKKGKYYELFEIQSHYYQEGAGNE
jgi:ABC-type multidrug transport system fused ATPase/permease subunit